MAKGEGDSNRAVIIAVIGLLAVLAGVLTSPIWSPGICGKVGLCSTNKAATGSGGVTRVTAPPATTPGATVGPTTPQSTPPTMVWTDADGSTMHWATIVKGKWTATQTFTDRHTNSSAAIAKSGGKVYMAWREPTDDHLFWSAFNGSAWTSPVRLNDRRTETAPALGASNGKLVMVWKDAGDGPTATTIRWSTFDGHVWSDQQPITDRHTRFGPALASAGGTLYMAWLESGDGDIYWSNLGDAGWSSPQSLPDRQTTTGPALGTDGSTVVMAWKGALDDKMIRWSAYDGTAWSSQTDFKPINLTTSPPNNLTSSAPGLSSGESTAIMVWRDPVGNINWSSFHNGVWGNAHVFDGTTATAPAMA